MAAADDRQQTPQSRFHGSWDYLKRLNICCMELDACTANRSWTPQVVSKNFNLLRALYKELSSMMTKDQRKFHQESLEELETIFSYFEKDMRNKRQSKICIFKYFDTWETSLREFQASRGLLMPDTEAIDAVEEDL